MCKVHINSQYTLCIFQGYYRWVIIATVVLNSLTGYLALLQLLYINCEFIFDISFGF